MANKVEKPTLGPCPFCGSTGLDYIKSSKGYLNWRCKKCNLESPGGNTEADMNNGWNRVSNLGVAQKRATAILREFFAFHNKLKQGALPTEVAMMMEESGILCRCSDYLEEIDGCGPETAP